MILHITGTNKNDNRCMETAAAVAAVSAIKYNRKTLILQMYSDETGIEHILDQAASEVYSQTNRNDTGIDNLLLWATSGALSQTHFDVSVIDMFKEHNLFDIAPVSKKRDAAVELKAQKRHLSIVIEKAEKIYDTVIIVTKWYDEDLKDMVSEIIGEKGNTIICMDQSTGYRIPEQKEEDPVTHFISDFDKMSSFTTKVIKKHYGLKELFTAPLCTEFTDARKKGSLMSFLIKNMDADVKSEAYEIIESYKALTAAAFSEDMPEEKELPLIEHFTQEDEKSEVKESEGHFEEIEEEITKGFWIFKKKILVKKKVFVSDKDENFENQSEAIKEEENVNKEIEDEEKESIVTDDLIENIRKGYAQAKENNNEKTSGDSDEEKEFISETEPSENKAEKYASSTNMFTEEEKYITEAGQFEKENDSFFTSSLFEDGEKSASGRSLFIDEEDSTSGSNQIKDEEKKISESSLFEDEKKSISSPSLFSDEEKTSSGPSLFSEEEKTNSQSIKQEDNWVASSKKTSLFD